MKQFPMTGRKCRGRKIAWSRVARTVGQDGPAEVTYHLFKRDSEGRVFSQSVAAMAGRSAVAEHAAECRRQLAIQLRAARAQLRWSVDQVEFARLGLQDDTPAPLSPSPPTSPSLGGQAPPFPAPAGTEWVAGDFGFTCLGKPRQDPPRLVYSGPCPLQLGGDQ